MFVVNRPKKSHLKPFKTVSTLDSMHMYSMSRITNNVGYIQKNIRSIIRYYFNGVELLWGKQFYNVYGNEKFIILYNIEKHNTKKEWTGRKRKGDQDKKVKSYKTVTKSHVVVRFYKIPMDKVAGKVVQYGRYFTAEVYP